MTWCPNVPKHCPDTPGLLSGCFRNRCPDAAEISSCRETYSFLRESEATKNDESVIVNFAMMSSESATLDIDFKIF
jgi:hypothetical protein